MKDDTREKISIAKTGKRIPKKWVPVISEKNGLVMRHESVRHAAEALGLNKDSVSSSLSKGTTLFGYKITHEQKT